MPVTSPAPTYIDTKFVKTYTRRPFDDADELVYVLTWADGSVTERGTIPNSWHAIYVRCVGERHDANLAKMAAEHAEGRIGGTHILSPNPIVSAIEVGRDAA